MPLTCRKGKRMPKPQTFTSDTDLPQKTGGSEYPQESGTAQSDSKPSDVKECPVFLPRDKYAGVKDIKGKAVKMGGESKEGAQGNPSDVQNFRSGEV